MEDRKKEHIKLAFDSQTLSDSIDKRFYYEPLLNAHPTNSRSFQFLGCTYKTPLWVSSMTGGTALAAKINANLAKVCNAFGMGMGLGSCRIILDDNTYFNDFNVRPLIGPDLPLWANLGISQIEKSLASGTVNKITELIKKLEANGLIIHVNPMQEWVQPEGDHLQHSPLITIQRFLDKFSGRVMVKEVGQGMGPESLIELFQLPLEAIEFAAFGGTNFAKVELQRRTDQHSHLLEPLTRIGNTADEMLELVNAINVQLGDKVQCKQIIISGGVKNFLDAHYYLLKSQVPAVVGMASAFLKYARDDYESLHTFVEHQVKGLQLAEAFLRLR